MRSALTERTLSFILNRIKVINARIPFYFQIRD